MRTGIGFYEIVLILVLMVIFVEPKKVPVILGRIFKIARQVRAEIKRFVDEFNKMDN